MFTDEYISGVTVKSSWKTHRKQRENGSQTSEILTYEADSQTVSAEETGCQTVPLFELLQNSTSYTSQNYDPDSLAAFLSLVEPRVTKQLKKNSSYNVFEELSWGLEDESSDTSIVCEYCLDEKSVRSETEKDEGPLEVTSLSWSSSGGSLAVGYGSMKHMAWGNKRSYLCIWNLNRAKVGLYKCDQKLEVESSLQMISFHPDNPALIAGGMYSGVVLLWDLSKDEVIYSTESHDDPVTSVCWLQPRSQKSINLMTGSADGKLIIWKKRMKRGDHPLEMVKKFKIKASSVGRQSGARGSGSVGVTCCAVAIPVQDGIEMTTGDGRTMIAGCENGAIVKCSINEDSLNEDPVQFSYKAHLGPVYSVDWSPFHRHIFLSCSTDQRCRIYHSLHATPLQEVTPYSGNDQYLFAACWSPAVPLTLFSAGGSGILTVYDASTSKLINSIESEGRNGKKSQINFLAANKKKMQFVATGNVDGIVHVWQLGTRLITSNPDAKAALDKLAEEAMTEE